MVQLSVNVNKIATVRNARGESEPNVAEFALKALEAGAAGITVHPRPDERHIRRDDVFELARLVAEFPHPREFNVEGYPDERYLGIIEAVKPHQATLVPDKHDAITSNAGWVVSENADFLRDVIARLKQTGARVSLFVEPDIAQVEAAASVGADRVEFYTEPFAKAFVRGHGRESFAEHAVAAKAAVSHRLGVNAGHDLNLANLVLMRGLPGLLEVSIGHALVVDALRRGWSKTVKDYLDVLAAGD